MSHDSVIDIQLLNMARTADQQNEGRIEDTGSLTTDVQFMILSLNTRENTEPISLQPEITT